MATMTIHERICMPKNLNLVNLSPINMELCTIFMIAMPNAATCWCFMALQQFQIQTKVQVNSTQVRTFNPFYSQTMVSVQLEEHAQDYMTSSHQ